ncbi:MAG: 50S ribosomal protein L11 methyltransferase [Succinivibrio sp.]|uniref:Ribosomal protein L11 methyltransferase n=1 Tax=Succinivibrio faecicola TaxID=2820300 RepID=A0ABS7DJ31_9GAMM|nr:50S ribosomal protein L11 methyltransferase [Succinivibrio sp.]MBW7571116.1 50S ribosomal protein L11 methyltransferase [Succinivibrio faecicola]MCI6939454.1 50S ribosomal protein L11 methyltransferase [Succinatimonas hippei]MDD6206724.1 50S ribosomal protein L11 methyltransferase [Succinivibrio sp.]
MTQNNDWIQIKIRTTNSFSDAVAELLEQLGALAVSYTDAEDSPILEPKPGERRLWPNTEVTGLLDKGTDPEPILAKLKAILGDHIPMAATHLEDKNWIRAWMDQFKPLKFGSHLWICPSWLKVEEENSVVVMLDPGLAFGTGTHPTTALCLGYLDSLDLKDKLVLDYGCGSGILAIAALKLGAKKAMGVDIDEQALQASLENAKRNDVDDRLELVMGTDKKLELPKSQITVANILAGPLAQLEPVIADLTASGGLLALSGILTEQADEVIEAYSKDFIMNKVKDKDGWALLTGTRK